MSPVLFERDPNKRLCCWPSKPSEVLRTIWRPCVSSQKTGEQQIWVNYNSWSVCSAFLPLLCLVWLRPSDRPKPSSLAFCLPPQLFPEPNLFLPVKSFGVSKLGLRKKSSNVYWGYFKLLLFMFSKRFLKKIKISLKQEDRITLPFLFASPAFILATLA